MRPRISIRGSVRPWVRWSVGPFVMRYGRKCLGKQSKRSKLVKNGLVIFFLGGNDLKALTDQTLHCRIIKYSYEVWTNSDWLLRYLVKSLINMLDKELFWREIKHCFRKSLSTLSIRTFCFPKVIWIRVWSYLWMQKHEKTLLMENCLILFPYQNV